MTPQELAKQSALNAMVNKIFNECMVRLEKGLFRTTISNSPLGIETMTITIDDVVYVALDERYVADLVHIGLLKLFRDHDWVFKSIMENTSGSFSVKISAPLTAF